MAQAYMHAWDGYLRQWDEFGESVVTHFSARIEERRRIGYGFLHTLSQDGVDMYAHAVAQDNGVRTKWLAACVEHEKKVAEFAAFRARLL